MTASPVPRRIINDPERLVDEALGGLAAAHGDLLRYDAEQRIVVSTDAPDQGTVGVISGGGTGHEPLHASYVGRGMLAAACPGQIFTSPVPEQIMAATRAVDGGVGVLHIVKNYTGDVLSFGMAAEAMADEGVEVETVLVADDVSADSTGPEAGRRGVGGTILVEKVAGAAAERGDDLSGVAAIARRAADRVRSFGISVSSCTPPAADRPLLDLPPGEMEVGVGMHGEPGRARVPLGTAAEIADLLVDSVLEHVDLPGGAPVLVFVNGFGGTTLLELQALHAQVIERVSVRGLTVARQLVGNYVTALEMAGASLTVAGLDDELLALWDAPVITPGLRWGA